MFSEEQQRKRIAIIAGGVAGEAVPQAWQQGAGLEVEADVYDVLGNRCPFGAKSIARVHVLVGRTRALLQRVHGYKDLAFRLTTSPQALFYRL